MTSYYIARAATRFELIEEIELAIEQGWVPVGGVSVIVYSNHRESLFQALVKTKEPNND